MENPLDIIIAPDDTPKVAMLESISKGANDFFLVLNFSKGARRFVSTCNRKEAVVLSQQIGREMSTDGLGLLECRRIGSGPGPVR